MKRPALLTVVGVFWLVATLPLCGLFVALHRQGSGGGGGADALANAGMFAVFAVTHSLMARNFVKRWLARRIGEQRVRLAFVLVASVSLVLLLRLWRPLGGTLWRTEGVVAWSLVALYWFLVAGTLYTTRFFDYLEFIGVRRLVQQARSRPYRTAVFSTRGPYGHCRHPLYALLLVAVWTAPTMSWTRAEFAGLATVYFLVGTLLEERNLREELGEVYQRYQANVPMWIPRLHAWRPDR